MKFDMSEAWREATAMMSANREVLLIVGGIFFFLPSLLLGLSMPDFRALMQADPEAAQGQLLEFYTSYWWLFALTMIVSFVGYLALLALLRDQSRPTVGQAMRTGLAGVLPAIGVYLLFMAAAFVLILVAGILTGISGSAAVGVILGLVCAIALVYGTVKLSLSAPVIAIEKIYNPLRVLARSWRLTRGNSVRLFLFFLLIIITYFVMSLLAGFVVSALLLVFGEAVFTMVGALVSGLTSAALAVVLVAVLAAVHRQLSGGSAERLSETFE